jgi:D-serine deaminase-like pyridoxal phosphate-dependent protein
LTDAALPGRDALRTTPALLVDAEALEHNLATMLAARPGPQLRPHVKAHKCTTLARWQATLGHTGFTCATIREVEGMAAAGLGGDLLLANEVLDTERLGQVVTAGNRVTLAVDSEATIDAAAAGGVLEVLIDVNVGMPRCGCTPEDAGRLADHARSRGLSVRGVMGYEGHWQHEADRVKRTEGVAESMAMLARAAADVGGDIVSGAGTGSYDCNDVVTEVQAGSYVMMDGDYGRLELPFRRALSILATVISVGDGWAVVDCGLKALAMDSGSPTIDGGAVWFCSDEHTTFSGLDVVVGDRVEVWPMHIDPTIAKHEALWLWNRASGDVVERWDVDLRGW